MDEVREINLIEGRRRLSEGQLFVDVRDAGSFQEAHVPGALHLNDQSLEAFLTKADKQKPVVVYCYHGHTSLGASAYLVENGFTDVVSLSGGFELWRQTEKTEA